MSRKVTIQEVVHNLERDLIAIKSNQASGSGNQRGYITESQNQWDIDYTATENKMLNWHEMGRVSMVFTADNQPSAFTTFEVTALINDLPFYYGHEGPNAGTFNIGSGAETQPNPDPEIAKYQTSQSVVWGISIGMNVKIKVRAVSVDTGTLEIYTNFL